MFDKNLASDHMDTYLITNGSGHAEQMVLWKLELLFPQFIGDHNRIVEMWVWKKRTKQVRFTLYKRERLFSLGKTRGIVTMMSSVDNPL